MRYPSRKGEDRDCKTLPIRPVEGQARTLYTASRAAQRWGSSTACTTRATKKRRKRRAVDVSMPRTGSGSVRGGSKRTAQIFMPHENKRLITSRGIKGTEVKNRVKVRGISLGTNIVAFGGRRQKVPGGDKTLSVRQHGRRIPSQGKWEAFPRQRNNERTKST